MSGLAAASPSGENAGERAISQLAERLVAMTPSTGALDLNHPSPPRPSPAVAAALSHTAAMTMQAEKRAHRAPRSFSGTAIGGFLSACALIPYALVALALRLVMARTFFLDGQTLINGPRFAFHVADFDFSVVLPLGLKSETITAFLAPHAMLPMPPVLAAYVVGYAEFLLPIILVLGLGTRIAAIGLLVVTALMQVYVAPQALWSMHVYWASILMVLLALGPGPVSADAIIRFASRR